jgi:hypothetical protein
MSQSGFTTRAHPRGALGTPLEGKVGERHTVRILDLSPGGACVAHTEILRPSDPCSLRFALQDHALTLTGRVVWSSVVARARGQESAPLFHSGLAFEEVPPAARAAIAQFLKPGSAYVGVAAPGKGSRQDAAPRAEGEGHQPFSAEAVRAAWAWAGRRCECKAEGHGHEDRCGCELIWERRGEPGPGGWQPRRRQPPVLPGTESEICEIVCHLCHQFGATKDG